MIEHYVSGLDVNKQAKHTLGKWTVFGRCEVLERKPENEIEY